VCPGRRGRVIAALCHGHPAARFVTGRRPLYHPARVPLNFARLFRVLIVLVLGAHVFFMYGLARAVGGRFGFSAGVCAVATGFALAMLLPLVWAVSLPEIPLIYTRVVRARRWWASGRCPACGYPRGEAEGACPECGAASDRPAPYAVTAATVRRYVAVNLLAWVLGCGAAEAWIGVDEAEFRREVAGVSAEHDSYRRPRRWPDGGTFSWDREQGFRSPSALVE